MGTLEPWKPCLPLILSPNNLRALFSIILFPVPLLLSFHLGSLHLFVFHYHLFVLSPIIPSPCFPSCCLPSFCGPLCNSHHHLFILSPIIPSSWLSSAILSPCILFPNIPLSCLRSSLRLVSLIILFFTILYPVIPSPIIPASPTAKNSWVQSLEAEQPVLVQGLRPQLLAMHPGPHHFVSHHPFILSPFVLFRAFSRHPCIPNYRELLGWISGSRGPVLPSPLHLVCLHLLSLHLVSLHLVSHRFVSPSSLHLVSLYVVGLHLFSHRHLFILSPITFILFPRIPSCCLCVPTHLFLIIILHSHYLFILSTVAPSSCLGSCCLALVCCPLSIVSFPLVSHAFHFVPHHFVLASAFFDHVLSVVGGYFLTLLLLGCTAGLICFPLHTYLYLNMFAWFKLHSCKMMNRETLSSSALLFFRHLSSGPAKIQTKSEKPPVPSGNWTFPRQGEKY